MKALSIRQPWCWLILHAGKDIENREWGDHYPALGVANRLAFVGKNFSDRGWFLIHAAKGMTRSEYDDACGFARQYVGISIPIPAFADLPRGGIVGTAKLIGVVRESPSPWFFGPIGLNLANARPLPFLPVKGALGFFDAPY